MRSSRVFTVVAAFSMVASCLHVRARRPVQARPCALSRSRHCIRSLLRHQCRHPRLQWVARAIFFVRGHTLRLRAMTPG